MPDAESRQPNRRHILVGGAALSMLRGDALALHELATNASKYGAFSSVSGALSVSWRIAEKNLELLWEEQDGPPPPAEIQQGFGYKVMTQMLSLAIKRAVRLEYPPTGCTWQVVAPLDRLVPDSLPKAARR
jgi:two-component sensor histidine kinase